MTREKIVTMYTLEDAEKIIKWRNRRKRNAKLRKLKQKLLGLLMLFAVVLIWDITNISHILSTVVVVVGAIVFLTFDDTLI